jgi:hypothetical protein
MALSDGSPTWPLVANRFPAGLKDEHRMECSLMIFQAAGARIIHAPAAAIWRTCEG